VLLVGIALWSIRAEAASFSLDFAHFGAGPVGGLELITELTLINALTREVEGVEVEFFKQDGTPNSVKIEGETTEKLMLSVDAESGRRLVVESADGILRVGWIRVSSPVALGGVIQFKYLDPSTGDLQTETALLPSAAGRKPLTFIDGPAAGVAVAVANPSQDQAIDLVVSIPLEGAALKVPISLGPGEQKAKFLSELHPLVGVDSALRGTLGVEVQSGEDVVIGTVLKLSEAGLTTFPLVVAPD
jgi:hypothetical protein